MNELTEMALRATEQAADEGPVIMINLLWFRNAPDSPPDFMDSKRDACTGSYEGYVSRLRAACAEVGVTPELLYAGSQLSGILAGPSDDWDEIVVVRYQSFADLRKILDNETYIRTAKPHHFAAELKLDRGLAPPSQVLRPGY